jgi:repressor LexA
MSKRAQMQQRIYDFILESIREHGYAPSVREIGDAVGLKSPSTVHYHLENLAERGLIEKGAFKGRAIVPRGNGEAARVSAPFEPAEPEGEFEPELRGGRIPIVGNVAAGSPILAQECIEDYLTFDVGGREDEYFALRVRGESMIGVGILSGDLVVVRRQQVARNGEIVVALLGDEATVKTFSRQDGRIWLLPENPEYQPIDGTNCSILGKVTAVVRQYF